MSFSQTPAAQLTAAEQAILAFVATPSLHTRNGVLPAYMLDAHQEEGIALSLVSKGLLVSHYNGAGLLCGFSLPEIELYDVYQCREAQLDCPAAWLLTAKEAVLSTVNEVALLLRGLPAPTVVRVCKRGTLDLAPPHLFRGLWASVSPASFGPAA